MAAIAQLLMAFNTKPSVFSASKYTMPASTASMYHISYTGGRYVAISQSAGWSSSAYSDDGVTWTRITTPTSNYWMGIAGDPASDIAIATNSSANTSNYMSYSAGVWTNRTMPTTGYWGAPTFFNGNFYVHRWSPSSLLYVSPDGLNWTSYTATPIAATTHKILYGNGVWIALRGASTTYYTSTNALSGSPTWTTRTFSAPIANTLGVNDSVFVNNTFVIGDNNGNIVTTTDGITMTLATTFPAVHASSVAYGDGLYVATGSNGTNSIFYSSPDLITWTARSSTNYGYLRGLIYGNNNRFVSLIPITSSSTSASFAVTADIS
jgi:hypothetical protein